MTIKQQKEAQRIAECQAHNRQMMKEWKQKKLQEKIERAENELITLREMNSDNNNKRIQAIENWLNSSPDWQSIRFCI
jgi:hypothetical protein